MIYIYVVTHVELIILPYMDVVISLVPLDIHYHLFLSSCVTLYVDISAQIFSILLRKPRKKQPLQKKNNRVKIWSTSMTKKQQTITTRLDVRNVAHVDAYEDVCMYICMLHYTSCYVIGKRSTLVPQKKA